MISQGFFVGWEGRLPPGHRPALIGAVWIAVALLMLGLATGRGTEGGQIDWVAGEKTLVGVATGRPYPLLLLENGHSVLLLGVGKTGVDLPAGMEGRRVEVRGLGFKRGNLDALEVHGDWRLVGDGVVPARERLGRWRISGEICDGKCASGGMRPGDGIAHRACASLCLIGRQPPVFVSTAPVEGERFMVLGARDGGVLREDLLRWVGVRVRLEGLLERRGDVLVFLVDAPR